MVATDEIACETNDVYWLKIKDELNIDYWAGDKLGNKRIGVALIGLGRMGLIHFRNILREPRAKLLYCIDSNQNRLDTCSKSMYFSKFSIRALHSDQLDIALEDSRVHAILIASPTPCHEEQTKRALKAGKSVMCEKPLTPVTKNIAQLYELARTNQVFLMTAFNRRYDPEYRQMRRRIKMGSLGSIQMVRITSRDCEPPPLSYVRLSAGLFNDTCIHDLDLCVWLMRQLPVSVQVMGKTWQEFYASAPDEYNKLSAEDRATLPQIDDYFMAIITLKFANNSLAVIDNSRQASFGYDQRCEVYGTRASIRCGDNKHSTDLTEYSCDAIKRSTLPYCFATRYEAAYVNELQDILTMAELAEYNHYDDHELIRQHLLEPLRPCLVLAAQTVADACIVAVKKGETVSLDWPADFERMFMCEIDQ